MHDLTFQPYTRIIRAAMAAVGFGLGQAGEPTAPQPFGQAGTPLRAVPLISFTLLGESQDRTI